MVKIKTVSSAKDLRAFIRFPEGLYKQDPLWAPPLWKDERKAYSGKTSAILKNSDYVLFLAENQKEIIGRTLVYIDHTFNTFYQDTIGFFGAFESVPDLETAKALFSASENWLKDRGMRALRGPIHPIAENWGFQIFGGDVPPIFMSSYNPPEYAFFMESLGYKKAKDLLVYEGHCGKGYSLPDRFLRFYDHFLKTKPQFRIRPLNLSNLDRDGEEIWRISNIALAENWGYVPLEREVLIEMIHKLKPIVDPSAVWFVEDQGKAVGYCLGFPDLNILLRRIHGRLFPLGFIHLLRGIKRLANYRLFGLAVLPEYHGFGLDVLMYVHLYQAVKERGIRMEANYILEDNFKIRNALEKLNLKHVKTYRVYEKPL